MPTVRRWGRSFATLVAIVALAGGCSPTADDDDDPTTTATTTATPASSTTTTTGPPCGIASSGQPRHVVQVVTPVNGDTVGQSAAVSGKLTGLPQGRQLWFVVKSAGGYHYPQPPVAVDADGCFTATAFFGNPASGADETFTLYAVLADATTAQQFQQYLDDQNSNGIGLNLPSGARVDTTVDVTRQ